MVKTRAVLVLSLLRSNDPLTIPLSRSHYQFVLVYSNLLCVTRVIARINLIHFHIQKHSVANCKVNISETDLSPHIEWFIQCHLYTTHTFSPIRCFGFHSYCSNFGTYLQLSPQMCLVWITASSYKTKQILNKTSNRI